ncbi:ANKRD17 [Symbiodinium sp. CCMP2456]|nr:ANKRD17 [Symbiodinium sp. CCMP2456]
MRCVRGMSGEELASFAAEDFRDVRELKIRLRSLHGFPLCLQQLLCDGDQLKDDDPVASELMLVLRTAVTAEQQHKAAEELVCYAADGGFLEVARLLLQAGADRNYCRYATGCDKKMQWDNNGCTALSRAANRGHVELVRLLLEAGADPDVQDEDGMTALMHAVHEGHIEIARLLVEAGAGKDLVDEEETTALMAAAGAGHIEIARLLVDAGANVNLDDAFGTALMWASSKGHAEIVHLLVDAGADINFLDSSGNSALSLARKKGHGSIAAFLSEQGCCEGPTPEAKRCRQ